MFSQLFLDFSSPSGITSKRLTYRGLPQGICLICSSLFSLDFKALLYANDIVLFSSDKFLGRSVNILNNALNILSTKLSASFFTIAPEKSYFMIFTRKQITA
uniref:Reverse transcriptase domain-containing protein n=1 Tax=Sipha flava TaxID=143950 RepID=A0A2S2QZM3_9HEMI